MADERSSQENPLYSIRFEIVGLPSLLNIKAHPIVAGKKRKLWRQWVLYSVGMKRPPKPLQRAKLTFTRFSSSEPDYDNMVGSFKPLVDGLVDARVIIDDARKNIGTPEYLWIYCPPRQGKIRIEVLEVRDAL